MADSQGEIELLHNLDNLVNDIREENITNCDMLFDKIKLHKKLLNVLHLNIRSLKKTLMN